MSTTWEPWEIEYIRLIAPASTSGLSDEEVTRQYSASRPKVPGDRRAEAFRAGWLAERRYDPTHPRLAIKTDRTLLPNVMYSTVRLGAKWLRHYLDGNHDVVLLDSKGEPFAKARLLSVRFVPIYDLPAERLLYSVNPQEYTPGGVLDMLRTEYSCFVDANEMATLLYFTVNS